jgi:hypothetical protein
LATKKNNRGIQKLDINNGNKKPSEEKMKYGDPPVRYIHHKLLDWKIGSDE